MRKTSGLSLLLLIFLSLCLITFSLLSFSEASADYRLSTQSVRRTTAYYAAVTTANQQLAQLDEQLASFLKEAEFSQTPAETYSRLCSTISGLYPEVIWDTPSSLSFSVSITETQVLDVCLSVPYPEAETDTLYQITEWRIVNTKDWNPDTSQNLLRLH